MQQPRSPSSLPMPGRVPQQLHPVHQHFEAEVCKKRQCKHCTFCQSSNVSRLRAHLVAAHPHLLSQASTAEVGNEGEPSTAGDDATSKKSRAADDYRVHQAKRQQLHQFMERKLTASQQYSMEQAQAYMSVMCLISHNSRLPQALQSFAPGDVRLAEAIVQKTMPMFLKTPTVLSNLFDHRLPAIHRSQAFAAMPAVAKKLAVAVPNLDDVHDFINSTGRFSIMHDECLTVVPRSPNCISLPFCFHSAPHIHSGTPCTRAIPFLTWQRECQPCQQARREQREFSAQLHAKCPTSATGASIVIHFIAIASALLPRLAFEKMKAEVYIRWNTVALSWK